MASVFSMGVPVLTFDAMARTALSRDERLHWPRGAKSQSSVRLHDIRLFGTRSTF